MKQNTTKQRDAISTIWQLFRDYFEEGSGSLRSNDDELIEQLDIYAREEKSKNWINVEDQPLFTKDEFNRWVCTEAGDNEFIAAVPTSKGWWIKHCVIEDGSGLAVVGDDIYTDPAGWSMEDVTHYIPMPEGPYKLN